MYKVLGAESSSGGNTITSSSVSGSQSKLSSKNPWVSLSESFISSGKQGGGATVLGEGCDIVARETCFHTSLNVNNLGKATVLHFAFPLFCGWGCAKLNM
jgi:hypothetical protein